MSASDDDRGKIFRRMAPGTRAGVVSPNDDEDNVPNDATLFIGTGGTITVIPVGQTDAVPFVVGDGSYLDVIVSRVLDTGTDADDIVWIS